MSSNKNEILRELQPQNEESAIFNLISDIVEDGFASIMLKRFFEWHLNPHFSDYIDFNSLDNIGYYLINMKEENFQLLLNFIQNNPKVKSLSWEFKTRYWLDFNIPNHFIDLSPERLQKLMNAIVSMPNLNHINLHGNLFFLCHSKCRRFLSGPCLLDIWMSSLKNCPNLASINFSYTPIGNFSSKHLKSIVNMIRDCKKLTKLNLCEIALDKMNHSRFRMLENAILENKNISEVLSSGPNIYNPEKTLKFHNRLTESPEIIKSLKLKELQEKMALFSNKFPKFNKYICRLIFEYLAWCPIKTDPIEVSSEQNKEVIQNESNEIIKILDEIIQKVEYENMLKVQEEILTKIQKQKESEQDKFKVQQSLTFNQFKKSKEKTEELNLSESNKNNSNVALVQNNAGSIESNVGLDQDLDNYIKEQSALLKALKAKNIK